MRKKTRRNVIMVATVLIMLGVTVTLGIYGEWARMVINALYTIMCVATWGLVIINDRLSEELEEADRMIAGSVIVRGYQTARYM